MVLDGPAAEPVDVDEEVARLVTLPQPGGFSAACNTGAAASSGELLVFLNDDTIPQPGWLDALVGYAERNPAAAIIGAKLLFADGRVQHAGVVVCGDGYVRHAYAGFPSDHPAVNRSRRFKIVTAACMLVRRQLFEQLAGFDTAYRNGYEDVDLCLRAGELGAEVHYCHESELVHLTSATRVGRDREFLANERLFEQRWGDVLTRDDLATYASDGLIEMRYGPTLPATMTVSPLLASVAEAASEAERELARCTRDLQELRRENTRLRAELSRTAPGDGCRASGGGEDSSERGDPPASGG